MNLDLATQNFNFRTSNAFGGGSVINRPFNRNKVIVRPIYPCPILLPELQQPISPARPPEEPEEFQGGHNID